MGHQRPMGGQIGVSGPMGGEDEDDALYRTEQRSICEGVYCENTTREKLLGVCWGGKLDL